MYRNKILIGLFIIGVIIMCVYYVLKWFAVEAERQCAKRRASTD